MTVVDATEARLKRLRMRSWRRGTKEMDLILGAYADDQLAAMSPAELDAYETLLDENDQDLYRWVSGQVQSPPEHTDLIVKLARFMEDRAR